MNPLPTIAIVHYHLRRGGVTRVIQNAVTALAPAPDRCVVCVGEPDPAGSGWDVPTLVIDELGYDEERRAPAPDVLLQRVRDAVIAQLGGPPDIWHIHNHHLGKNAAWTRAVAMMAAQGQPLLLHIHDFPEDGRPANYRYLADRLRVREETDIGAMLYPLHARTHYAVLNGRDYKILERAGIPSPRLHLLPNAVWTGEPLTKSDGDPSAYEPPLILYPTRAIRRKNIGEFLFWSAMEEGDAQYGVTLAPQTEAEQPCYARWKQVAAEMALPVSFEMGLSRPYPELLRAAHWLVTTSIGEGFGLAFLEPWLSGRPLAGRNLPEITAEFAEAGVDLSGLYSALTVPADWIDCTAYRRALWTAWSETMTAYGRVSTEEQCERVWASAFVGTRIEFSRLNERLQEGVLRRIHRSRTARSEVDPPRLFPEGERREPIERNKARVAGCFNLDQYRARLVDVYDRVQTDVADGGEKPVRAEAVLDQFLSPDRFYLLRS